MKLELGYAKKINEDNMTPWNKVKADLYIMPQIGSCSLFGGRLN